MTTLGLMTFRIVFLTFKTLPEWITSKNVSLKLIFLNWFFLFSKKAISLHLLSIEKSENSTTHRSGMSILAS